MQMMDPGGERRQMNGNECTSRGPGVFFCLSTSRDLLDAHGQKTLTFVRSALEACSWGALQKNPLLKEESALDFASPVVSNRGKFIL
jgi:hypothetical protein